MMNLARRNSMSHDREDIKAQAADAHMNPTILGSRRFYSGFYDRSAQHGVITGSGPNFDSAMEAHKDRQKQAGLPGVWRNTPRPARGTRRDIDYKIMEWI